MSSRYKLGRRWRRLKRSPGRLLDRLVALGATLVSPVERIFSAASDKVFALSEDFTGVESLAVRVGRLLRWPIQMVWNVTSTLFAALVPRVVQLAVTRRFHSLTRFGRRLNRSFVRLAGALNLDRFVLRLAAVTKPVWYPVGAFAAFFYAWFKSRRYKRMLWGLPVFVLLLPIPLLTGWMLFRGQLSTAAQYRMAVNTAQKEKDYARVQLFERKLAQLGVDTRLSEFNTARLLEQDGKLFEAYERMQRLAPLNTPGYAQAHFWIIQQLLQNKLNIPPDDAHKLIRIHLDSLAALGVKGMELDLIQANWLSHANRTTEASALLKPLVYRNRLAAIERFRIDLTLKHNDDAGQDALAIREHMQRERRSGGLLTGNDYQWWVAAEERLGDFGRVRKLLSDWIKQEPENEAARRNLATIYLREFDEILQSTTPDPQELALRIRNAFELTNPPENVKHQVAALYQQKSTRPELVELFEQLRNIPDLSPSLAEILGTAAAVSGDWDRAEFWLRQAVTGDASNAVAWNNLACVLLQHANPPLDSALAAADKAVQFDDQDFRFRQTRGQILLRLGRYQESVNDLEFALNGMPDVPTIHESLAKAYGALGNKQLAAIHQQIAN